MEQVLEMRSSSGDEGLLEVGLVEEEEVMSGVGVVLLVRVVFKMEVMLEEEVMLKLEVSIVLDVWCWG